MSSVEFERPAERRRRTVVRPFVPETSRAATPQSRQRSRCPELDCLRGRLPPGTLAAAERRALAIGIGADRVLIAAGIIGEDDYVAALAAWLRVPFETLEIDRGACPLPDPQFIDAAKSGLLPFYLDGAIVWVVAPQAWTARRLVTGAHPLPKDRFRLTSPARLQQFVLHHGTQALGTRAADALRNAHPAMSAAVCPPRVRAGWLAGLSVAASIALLFHGAAAVLTSAALALTFLAWTGLRLAGAATTWRGSPALRIPAHELPIYTIIVALYDEADAVPGLVEALRQLDYPAEKLQVMIALEPDDTATQDAFVGINLGPPFEIVIAPGIGPRTKPKALNAALALARGTFTAVFDAEDRPARNQLSRALDVFMTHGDSTACVQARLTIDNTRDSWLSAVLWRKRH